MLSAEANEMLTRVGAGTPAGELLRRYWMPVCYAEELDNDFRTKRVRMLGEQLVVYTDGSGRYGVLGEYCLHRHASLAYGFVESDCTLRCPYHGWKYDSTGKVVEQPFEPAGTSFREKLQHTAYPAEELGGVIFTYMGPDPCPVFPRWKILTRTDGVRELERHPELQCNWLQIQENSADVTHTYFLHGHMLHTRDIEHPGLDTYYRPFTRYAFQEFHWGLLKHFTIEKDGELVDADIGNPLIFPNMLRVVEGQRGTEMMHWRVPVDDETTRLFVIRYVPDEEAAAQGGIESVADRMEWANPDGSYRMDYDFFTQDRMAWETQGKVFDRTEERLGAADRGIILFRRMLRRAIEQVERGDDPSALPAQATDDRVVDVDADARAALEHVGDLDWAHLDPSAQRVKS